MKNCEIDRRPLGHVISSQPQRTRVHVNRCWDYDVVLIGIRAELKKKKTPFDLAIRAIKKRWIVCIRFKRPV